MASTSGGLWWDRPERCPLDDALEVAATSITLFSLLTIIKATIKTMSKIATAPPIIPPS